MAAGRRLLLALALTGSGEVWAQAVPDALDHLNAAFRAAYGQAKVRQLAGTVLLVDGDRVLLLRDQTMVAQALIRPPLYHRLKDVDHVPLALYLTLAQLPSGPLPAEARASLGGLRTLIEAARAGLSGSFPQGALLQRQVRILERSRQVLEGFLRDGEGGRPSLDGFAQELAPLLMANA